MRNQVISFLKNNRELRFVVKSVKIQLNEFRRYQSNQKHHVLIALKNEENNRESIHPISEFIFEKWKGKSYNTQRARARDLVQFLNYVFVDKSDVYKLKSISDLTLLHASDFLNYLVILDKSRVTVKSSNYTLWEFYNFLFHKNIICVPDKVTESKLKTIRDKDRQIQSPFPDVTFPIYNRKNVAHTIPEEYILLFIETCVRVANPIALGVYMQCFGGIRTGSLVNIKRSSISSVGAYGESGLIVTLKDQYMRNDILDSSGSCYVKKDGNILVFSIRDWLSTLYRAHINTYIPTDKSNALFVNRDGKAMTGWSYRYYFHKAKYEFLKVLRDSSNPRDKMWALRLESLKWSTHIGRGIFSNLLSEEAKNPYDIAIPRNDSTLTAAMVYQGNTYRMKENIEKRIEVLYKDYLPKLIP